MISGIDGRRGASGGGTSGDEFTFFVLPSGTGRGDGLSELGRAGRVRFGRRAGSGGLLHGVGGGGGKLAIDGESGLVAAGDIDVAGGTASPSEPSCTQLFGVATCDQHHHHQHHMHFPK